MALIERQVALAVAATATALSPRAREAVRKGAVYGLAGMLKAGDVVVGGARGAARGAAEGISSHDGAPAAGSTATPQQAAPDQPEPATPSTRRRRAAT